MAVTAADVVAELRRAGLRDLDDSALTRDLYSSDASLYRVPPLVVVRPYDADEVAAALAVCRATGTSLTARGAGTSIAGNAVGTGVVLDFSQHMRAVLDVDTAAGTARVQPGVVHAALQATVAPAGWRFGPDPSTHNRCTVGGMIGNNACGARALAYGRTSDNVLAVSALTAAGEHLAGPSGAASRERLKAVVDANLGTIRTEMGTFGRQGSGYGLEHLLPERGFDLTRLLVGSEGTLAILTEATVRLVRDAPHRALVLLGYPSMAEAADDAPALLSCGPTACEGLDARIVEVVRAASGPSAVPELPGGRGWLFVEVGGQSTIERDAAAASVVAAAGTSQTRVVTDRLELATLWRIREDGAGLAARTLRRQARSGWEDAAVPPERLGAYLRDFDALLRQHQLDGVPYGHFGDGCVHVRIDFPLDEAGGTLVYRSFVEDAARLVASYGGSLSGEHGDGRARSELLPAMYSPAAIAAFEQVKDALDPSDLLNPGVLVRPRPLDADLRRTRRGSAPGRTSLRLVHDGGDLSAAVHRCTGVGKCIADTTSAGGVMCPSYVATRQEKDSTRGRARVLQEMVGSARGVEAYRSPQVHDALDLCLACKGCARDCPTGVDMASYKAEVLHQTWRRRLRPRSHYTLGWLPRWAGLATRVPRLANALLRTPATAALAKRSAGVDPRRSLPSFATPTLRAWARSRPGPVAAGPLGRVAVWGDTFTDGFSPAAGRAVVRVLEAAGYEVVVPDAALCCGLTWISTGQLDGARRQLTRTVAALAELMDAGVLVVGVEPSCTAVLRSDVRELLDDPRAERVAAGIRTLAELLRETPGWVPPDLSGRVVVAQPHCHHAAVLGWEADAELLLRAGAAVSRLGGCCGLAGNFGVEQGHHDVSVAIAEHDLLPAVRSAPPGAVVLADGFSCRTQLDDLAGVRAIHLAELLAEGLRTQP
jgi:FAD/FMN-containing dehydrogenase/Fe-S oxidoreductase